MRAKQSILGLVYTGSEVRRPPLVGMQFLHQGAVRPADVVAPRPRLQAKDQTASSSVILPLVAARRCPPVAFPCAS
jgi:hypothetical protein